MFPGHSPDHQAPSGNPKTKAIGAGAARRKPSLHHHGSPERPQPHRGTDGWTPGQALASDQTSRDTSNQHSGHSSIWLQSVASLHLHDSPSSPGLQHPTWFYTLFHRTSELMKLLLLSHLPALCPLVATARNSRK